MKKILLIIFFFYIFFINLYAEDINWEKLVNIVIQIESGGNPYAVSSAGCIGLMQISRAVYKEYVDNTDYICSNCDGLLFNPDLNRTIGTWYLKRIWYHYLPHYKIPQMIDNLLIGYNWGIGNLNKWYKNGAKKNQLPKETKDYIKKYHKLMKGEDK